ncbi:stress-activated map kinase interacting protein 1-domain-containing protein [Dipodascopsis tothii]|uniref:stress-activated map kinase interacting protein 1-domain-containing protein n=1 Tax=Dipodascopsis tothii TaxID=44089 RepID=UPI0034CD576D
MSLLQDPKFVIYNLRHGYLSKTQDGVAERVIHIPKELADSVSVPGYVCPWEPRYEFSPPIPSFVESEHTSSGPYRGHVPTEDEDRALSRLRSRPSARVRERRAAATTSPVRPEKPKTRRRLGLRRPVPTDASSSSDSDFDDDDGLALDETASESGSGSESESGSGSETESDATGSAPGATAMVATDSFGGAGENDELGIEDLQRAARKIKFSKMPARAKDLIPDPDQVVSTYIQTANAGGRRHRRKHRHKNTDWDGTALEDLGMAGKADSRHGMTFLRSASYKRDLSFEKRFPAAWNMMSIESTNDGADAAAEGVLGALGAAVPAEEDGEAAGTASGAAHGSANGSTTAAADSTLQLAAELSQLSTHKHVGRVEPVPKVSNLTELIKQSMSKAKNPFERFASASGDGDLRPLTLKIYCPSSATPRLPFVVVVKYSATVADTIGYALYRYWEDKVQPELAEAHCDASQWALRIIEEDGEPDLDFPALDRKRIISAFSFDEFALVRE